jgi:UDP-N-acetylmuramoyl-tripeptide--D-alanyl-D-alanine ligase
MEINLLYKRLKRAANLQLLTVRNITDERLILVNNVLESLQDLANFHRRRFSIPFLAITGSNGKTTSKELIREVISKKYKVLATKGNLNNHIGVPLTLLSINEKHEFAIIEMGANHVGEIELLCNIAEPDYGLITNIGKAHLEGFGSVEGIKKGKSELYKHLKNKSGRVFVNGDDDVLTTLAIDNDKITFGCKRLYDVIGKDLSKGGFVSFKYTTRYSEKDWNKIETVNTQINGVFNFVNCLAATCVGVYFKVPESLINEALEGYLPDMNRSQLVKTNKNTLILDAYNANPDSMKAAIDNFAGTIGNKLLILGDMFELGTYSAFEHQKVIDLVIEKQFEHVLLVGKEFKAANADNFKKFNTTQECKLYLLNNPYTGMEILIKGSRGMKLETLQEVL